MNGAELKAIRHQLGLTTLELGRAFGYRGSDNTISVQIRTYESGGRLIPPWIARLAAMFQRYGVPEGWTDAPTPRED
jgi:transcriptional regulator with XRE-family HTH domain